MPRNPGLGGGLSDLTNLKGGNVSEVKHSSKSVRWLWRRAGIRIDGRRHVNGEARMLARDIVAWQARPSCLRRS